VLDWDPELFIYLGDNIYGDTRDMAVLESKYATLGRRPEFLALRAAYRPLQHGMIMTTAKTTLGVSIR
jgi:hypothetical protein